MLIDVNVDMGESFGRWALGDDAGMMPYISSASIACGFHAGDPATMRRTVQYAVEHGVQIGVHVGLPDLLGFGRRRMAVDPAELRDYVTFQIGALWAFVRAEGGTLAHVKPHGALYVMCSADAQQAEAVIRAIADVDPDLILLLLNDHFRDLAQGYGVRLVNEAFVDLHYDRDGNLILERVKHAWDPTLVGERAARFVKEQRIRTVDGGDIESDAPTFCLHGDAPNAVDVARTVRERLDHEGITIAPLREVLRQRDSVHA